MKYLIIILIIVALLVGFYFVFGRTEIVTDVTNIKTQKIQMKPLVVSAIRDNVSLQSTSTKAKVVEPALAYDGDLLETDASGRALLQAENGTLTTVDYSTKLTIKTRPDDEHSSMVLEGGKVWSTVEKVFGKGEYYEIETQNAVAVVRGTSFGFSFDGEQSILEVTEGAVLFVPIDQKTGERLYDKAVLVGAGKKAIIGSDGVVKIFDLDQKDKDDEWFIFNNGDALEQGAAGQRESVRIRDLQINAQ